MSIVNEIQRLQSAKTNIKAAIENKGVTVGDGLIDTYAEKIGEISGGDYDQGYEDGKNSVVDYLQYVGTISGLYQYCVFPTDTELELYLPMLFAIKGVTSSMAQTFFYAKGLKSLKLKCNERNKPVMYQNAFYYCDAKTIDLTEFNTMISNFTQTFMGCSALEEIKGELDFSQCTTVNTPFHNTSNLIEIRFKANTLSLSISLSASSKLSDESIQSIIDGLADLTGGTAQTLTLHANVGAKLSDEQKATITAKNWTLVY